MSATDNLPRWLRRTSVGGTLGLWLTREPLPPVLFTRVCADDRPPPNAGIEANVFYFVSQHRRPKWALFQCPCGCGSIVTLSLQPAHHPHWTVRRSRNDRPTLHPSIWRDVGCMSHFLVVDGRIYWCGDSGTSPGRGFDDSSSTEGPQHDD
jgi:hypothetical protein